MINILIAKDEDKIKNMLSELLQKEGYSMSDRLKNDIITIGEKGESGFIDSLKDKVIQLGDLFYKERRGRLYRSILETIEKSLIAHVLERTEGNQLKAARILGINRNTIRAKIRKLGIDTAAFKR